ncbi:DUF6020 family protein [Butyrivibrio sp. VCB2006]|uniref:DUF6020 family protein n=1 Tax=Butyrivibrio sp. VCB2006 TaxID=1280679 RepID=UPI0004155F37|nr:DUF6020 family protein [Butyrivibrio sp. VCB2006]
MNKKICKSIIAALFTASAFFITLDTPDPYEAHITRSLINAIFKFFEQVKYTFAGNGFYILVVASALAFIYYRFMEDSEHTLAAVKGDRILAGFLSIMYAGGRAFAYNDSLSSIWTPKFNLIKTAILVIGFYFLYILVIRGLNYIFNTYNLAKPAATEPGAKVHFTNLKKMYHAHPWLFSFVLIYLSWIIHLIMRYPAALSADNWYELNQYFGVYRYDNAQPIFHTWITSQFVLFGRNVFGAGNVGIFIYVCIQSAIMALVLGFTQVMLYKWKSPKWLRLLVFFLYCCTPYFMGNAAWAIKDYPHMIGYVIIALCLISIVVEHKTSFSVKRDWKLILVWIIGTLMLTLFRKNGLHIYYGTCAVLVITYIVLLVKKKAKFSPIPFVVMVVALLLSNTADQAVIVSHNVTIERQKDAYSFLFQQTARYVRDYGSEVTEEERAAIDGIIEYDKLAKAYTPHCSDNVKSLFRSKSTDEQLSAYFKTWFKMFFKHPMCYVEATWNQSYYIFMPDFDNIVYNQDVDAGKGITTPELIDYLQLYVPESMQGLPIMICSFYRMVNSLPIISSLNNLALYVIVMLSIMLFMLNNKLGRYIITFVPVLLCIAFIFLAPMIRDQPRYSWAVFYIMPTLVGMYMHLLRTNK